MATVKFEGTKVTLIDDLFVLEIIKSIIFNCFPESGNNSFRNPGKSDHFESNVGVARISFI